MKILVVHAWLRGNLGDVLQLSVLLSALRELEPRTLDLAGFPPRPADAAEEVLALSDRYVPDPFAWYWDFFPTFARKRVFAPAWRARRKAIFTRYDAIVCAPGPYLADYDARAPSALCDVTVARELGLPVVLSSHSIGPLPPDALAAVAKATVCISREPSTHDYLRERGIPSTLSADLAFLYPYVDKASRAAPLGVKPPYRVIFLRSNNVEARALRFEEGALFEGSRLIAEASTERLILATSDIRRDERFLSTVGRRLGVSWFGCRSVVELVQLIAGSSGVVSDRYHPAICGAVLGKAVRVLSNREPHKMEGLKKLMAGRTVEESQELARAGLRTLRQALRGVA
jgi:polysaccharide pyruvyl transferase WcaK-like protein